MFKTIAMLVAMTSAEAIEPPSDAEVLRAMPRVTRPIPYIYEECRDDITIVKNCMSTETVAVKTLGNETTFKVMVTKWKCDVFYAETTHVSFPFSVSLTKNRAQVVYIEKATVVK